MKYSILLVFFFSATQLIAQPLRLHLGGGFANYNGDLQAKSFTLNQAQGVVSAGATFNLSDKFSLRSDYSFAHIGADDKLNPSAVQRNLNFKTIIQEFSLAGEYDIFDLSEKKWSPYAFAGVGVFNFSPYTMDQSNKKTFLQNLGTEGQGLSQYPGRVPYKKTQFSIPIGGGLKYALSDDIYLAGELGFRKLFTDYVDDVSSTYVDENTLLAARGQQAVDLAFRGDEVKTNPQIYPADGTPRGNAKQKDSYYFGQIRISFRMNWFDNMREGGGHKSKYGCPTRIM